MKRIILLTQDSCPKCVVLEHYLVHGLNNRYETSIDIIKRESNPKMFMNYARRLGIMATPALIVDGDVLTNPDSSNTLAFLEKHGF